MSEFDCSNLSLTMMQGMSFTLASSNAHSLPSSTLIHYQKSVLYLQEEASLIAIFAPIITRLCIAEVESYTDLPDLEGLIQAWPAIAEACDRWKQTRTASSRKLPVLIFSTDIS